MTIGLLLVLLPLFFFKYYNFVNESIFSLLELTGLRWHLPQINWMLPIGISFYTFMAIGYIVDVYNEEIEAEKNLGLITLFLSYFPLVLSGPIERAPSMLPQFKKKMEFNYPMVVTGLQMILWGYFMKLVVADRLSVYIDPIISSIDQHSGGTIFLATLLYPMQIYCDLGGYSLIAIGAASVMGLKVRPNFNRPFFAMSVSEFWRRWHMSLISWILDYVYTPLSFMLRKYKMKGVVFTITLTLFIMGMWHGARLTFLVWAFYQGFFISLEAITKKRKSEIERRFNLTKKVWYILISIIITYIIFAFSFLTGGIRHTVSEGILAVIKMFTHFGPVYIDKTVLLYAFLGIAILLISEFRDEFYPNKFLFFNNKNVIIRWLSYFSVLLVIFIFGVFKGSNFIYFNF
ncbi:MBOAT family O-acyltransferase [Carboxylicivirga caseinilyticus]|uniref:MBOAT family O-acyltransferase n=1 Tax=Carboxylicivirga caseinilyticus TaxID=3417572 RepID=UPI002AA6CDA8|nr:MBOAT family O-acyltransferase [uncultured Carboxylicivirga sp.]MCU4166220.1 MBOAT family protein [Marinilabiliaceae bacterium A049]